MKKLFQRTVDCIRSSQMASKEAIADLHELHHLVIKQQEIASKKTHYEDLDKWSSVIYGLIHDKLEKYGFENGNVEKNFKNADVSFWWNIYGLVGNIIYSPNLKTKVQYHHASAFERNRALLAEINEILDNL
jgi:hypothetical protein